MTLHLRAKTENGSSEKGLWKGAVQLISTATSGYSHCGSEM